MTRATGSRGRTAAALLLGLLAASLVGGSASAYERKPPGSSPPQARQLPRQMPQMFRPQPNSNAQGVPPGMPTQYDYNRPWSPSRPQAPQGYSEPSRPRQSSAPPYLEVKLSRARAYVQQNLILTVAWNSDLNERFAVAGQRTPAASS